CAPKPAEQASGAAASAAKAPSAERAGPPGGFSLPQSNWQPPIGPARSQATWREPCAQRDPLRQALYGDLHVHTAFSMDVPELDGFSTPDDASRFARGETVELPGPDRNSPHRRVQLERPLDFAAVTDHSEWLGEVSLCMRAGSPVYASQSCR